jgi:hypothetical protein
MEWSGVKMGVEQFDMLHAYGLGILLATACSEPVELRETARCYTLSCPVPRTPRMNGEVLLQRVLPLPRAGTAASGDGVRRFADCIVYDSWPADPLGE